METELRSAIRTALWRLAAIYAVVFLVLVVGAASLSHVQHKRLADLISQSVRNSLVIRDFRQVVSYLNSTIGNGFDSIIFFDHRGETVFSLPGETSMMERTLSWADVDIVVPVTSTENIPENPNDANLLGKLIFKYSLVPPVALSFAFWVFCLVLAIPTYYRLRTYLETRHREIVKNRETAILAEVAQQVSHDIRSPLSAINMTVAQLASASEDQRQVIQGAAKRINEIAGDLLNKHKNQMSSPSAQAKVPVVGVAVELGELIGDLYKEKRAAWGERAGLVFDLDLRDEGRAQSVVDRKELSRLVSNLLNNSREAISDHGGKITLAFRAGKRENAIIISDTGRGIPQEVLEKLGKEKITHGKTQSGESGSGLGVYHAQKAVEAMQGRLSIQSREDMGTVVTISFPRV